MSEQQRLEKIAYEMRTDILNMAHKAGVSCHIGPSLSCADIMAALYFKFLRLDPEKPKWPERDRFVMSKGHAGLIAYSALARRGFFPMEEMWKVKHVGSILQGHPDMKKTPGIDMTSGSLGNGLSLAFGMGLGLRVQGSKSKVVALLGDGDSQEGAIWEAAMSIARYRLSNVIAILDYNHFQSAGSVEDIMPMEPMADKWRAFGWAVLELNGHDMHDIVSKLEIAWNYSGQPMLLLAHTVKGKGVSFMEHNNKWHGSAITEAEYEQGMLELNEKIAALTA